MSICWIFSEQKSRGKGKDPKRKSIQKPSPQKTAISELLGEDSFRKGGLQCKSQAVDPHVHWVVTFIWFHGRKWEFTKLLWYKCGWTCTTYHTVPAYHPVLHHPHFMFLFAYCSSLLLLWNSNIGTIVFDFVQTFLNILIGQINGLA